MLIIILFFEKRKKFQSQLNAIGNTGISSSVIPPSFSKHFHHTHFPFLYSHPTSSPLNVHGGPEQPRVLGHSLVRLLVRSHRSLIHFLRTTCFACTLCCAHLLARLFMGKLISRWLFCLCFFLFWPMVHSHFPFLYSHPASSPLNVLLSPFLLFLLFSPPPTSPPL